MRFFLELSFDGSSYHGWQIQPNAITVQELLNKALSTLLKENIDVVGAGRTDTGVHASQMYCHFDASLDLSKDKDFVYHLNALLPSDIAVKNLISVPEDAHSRFDAESRTYHYRICLSKNPFEVNRAWIKYMSLDIDKMNRACDVIKTYSDFSCFSKSNTQTKTNNCKIMKAEWKNEGEILLFTITADRFLRNMVRAIVGTLIEVGKGQMSMSDLEVVLKSGDRSKAGTSVPAHGLYLAEVSYPSSVLKSQSALINHQS